MPLDHSVHFILVCHHDLSTHTVRCKLDLPGPEVITTLPKAGADLEARASDGRTALMYAAWYNKASDVITTLLKAGAYLEARANDGATSLMLAARYSQNPEVVTTRLKARADAKAVSDEGKWPLTTHQIM